MQHIIAVYRHAACSIAQAAGSGDALWPGEAARVVWAADLDDEEGDDVDEEAEQRVRREEVPRARQPVHEAAVVEARQLEDGREEQRVPARARYDLGTRNLLWQSAVFGQVRPDLAGK